jgi:hypothetical protein
MSRTRVVAFVMNGTRPLPVIAPCEQIDARDMPADAAQWAQSWLGWIAKPPRGKADE